MGQIYLVRHGQASFDADDYDQLSPLGAQQARRLGDWFARCERRVDAVHLGTLRRHRQTAEHFVETLRADLRAPREPAVDAGFDEYDHEAILLAARPEFASPAGLRTWTAQQPHPRRAFQQLFAEALLRWVSGRNGRRPHQRGASQQPGAPGGGRRPCADHLPLSHTPNPDSENQVKHEGRGPLSRVVILHICA